MDSYKDELNQLSANIHAAEGNVDELIMKYNQLADEHNRKLSDDEVIAYTDGSYTKDIDKYGYGVVLKHHEKIAKYSGFAEDTEYLSHHNVAGEILAVEFAVSSAIKKEYKKIFIYHDYEGVGRWADGSWKANYLLTQRYQKFINRMKQYIDIEFISVPAHKGITVNDEADNLAKLAIGIN